MISLDLGGGTVFSSIEILENNCYMFIHIYIQLPLTGTVWRFIGAYRR